MLAFDRERLAAGRENVILGQPRTSWSATLAASPITCSQLSRITSNCRSLHAAISDCGSDRPGCSGTPRTPASFAGDQRRVRQWREIDKPGPIARPVQHARCELQREPRLAHAPGASQRDHASARQQLPKLAQLALSTDEAGDLGWQIVRRVPVLALGLAARTPIPQRPTGRAQRPSLRGQVTLPGEGSPARAGAAARSARSPAARPALAWHSDRRRAHRPAGRTGTAPASAVHANARATDAPQPASQARRPGQPGARAQGQPRCASQTPPAAAPPAA